MKNRKPIIYSLIFCGFLAAGFCLMFGDRILTIISDSGIMPRSVCWQVKSHLLMPNYTAHAVIALSYFGIAVRLFLVAYRRGKKTLTLEFWVYGSFIGLCGFSHVTALLMFFYGIATLDTVNLVATAFVSAAACIRTFFVAEKVENAPDVEEIESARREYESAKTAALKQSETATAAIKLMDAAATKGFEMVERALAATSSITGEIHKTNS